MLGTTAWVDECMILYDKVASRLYHNALVYKKGQLECTTSCIWLRTLCKYTVVFTARARHTRSRIANAEENCLFEPSTFRHGESNPGLSRERR